MGRSRRERVVALTQTRKHFVGREAKQAVVEDVRAAVDKYASIYVFTTRNMRNTLLRPLRSQWKDSRFFFGRHKLAQVALGRSEAQEYADGLRKVAYELCGNVGLLFTNRGHEQVVAFFERFEEADFARSGFVATEDVQLPEGVLEGFETSQEHNLRLVGLPVVVKKGSVCLERDFTVCETGEKLTPEKAKILEFIGVKMAKFRVALLCYYCKKDGMFERLHAYDEDMIEREGEVWT